ncbi:Integrase catalytic domain-containing protein [Citrus sinensis]|nr:Integrase catalytic domain-containing protein [Citrus sinensis]
MAGSKIDLEKFTGNNDFNMWKVKMETLLITQWLGDALKPITKKEGSEASISSSSMTPQQAAEIDKKARTTIILSLGDSMIREVAREKTVVDLWAKLERVYMTKSLANRLYIKKMMFTLKMVEGSSLEDHIDEFNKVCDTLEIIYEDLDDEGKALLLVSSLLSSYSNFVDALMYGRQTLSLDEVKAALNTRGLQEKSGNMSSGEVLAVKAKTDKYDGKKKKQGNNKQKTKSKKCFQCQKEGYFKKDCLELKNKKMEQNGAAVTAEEEGYESVGVCVAIEHVQKGMLDEMGLSIKLESNELRISNGDGVVMKCYKRNGVYVLDGEAITDLWGPAQTISLGGSTYFLSIIDDYSRRVWVYVLKHKDQVFGKFREWKFLVENQTGLKVKKLRTDNGLEFCNQEFDGYCANHGITRHRTVRLTPQQNGLVERMNRTLMDRHLTSKPHLRNGVENQQIMAALKYLDVQHMHMYIISRDVVFNEKVALDIKKPTDTDALKGEDKTKIQFEVKPYNKAASGDEDNTDLGSDDQKNEQVRQTEAQHQEYQLTRDREKRKVKAPIRYGYADLIAYALTASHQIDDDEPKNYKEAI